MTPKFNVFEPKVVFNIGVTEVTVHLYLASDMQVVDRLEHKLSYCLEELENTINERYLGNDVGVTVYSATHEDIGNYYVGCAVDLSNLSNEIYVFGSKNKDHISASVMQYAKKLHRTGASNE